MAVSLRAQRERRRTAVGRAHRTRGGEVAMFARPTGRLDGAAAQVGRGLTVGVADADIARCEQGQAGATIVYNTVLHNAGAAAASQLHAIRRSRAGHTLAIGILLRARQTVTTLTAVPAGAV